MEFGGILGKYRVWDVKFVGSKGLMYQVRNMNVLNSLTLNNLNLTFCVIYVSGKCILHLGTSNWRGTCPEWFKNLNVEPCKSMFLTIET